ncbi:hypothetical protein HYPSUDRAFT_794092 [Hypholoma sublateritium FD-334 SS-4]|uniref:Uncharacterized protein n=1 Tax=Hypholoma sublateritium (strain FD-334 SS-4) TaxID=945553 RepID=A0A0D2MVK3_HYPSF|nr:hypothetical protein HYPSUDRAFT_794092 [Hypholoma sublateritium FD-334 SS-4]
MGTTVATHAGVSGGFICHPHIAYRPRRGAPPIFLAMLTLPFLCSVVRLLLIGSFLFFLSLLLPLIWFSSLLFIAIEFYIHLLNNISRSQALDITAHTTFLFYYLRSQTMGGVYFRFRFGHPKLLWTAFLPL